MAWCHQATSLYQSQCWPRSSSPFGITRPQGVKRTHLQIHDWWHIVEHGYNQWCNDLWFPADKDSMKRTSAGLLRCLEHPHVVWWRSRHTWRRIKGKIFGDLATYTCHIIDMNLLELSIWDPCKTTRLNLFICSYDFFSCHIKVNIRMYIGQPQERGLINYQKVPKYCVLLHTTLQNKACTKVPHW